MRAHHSVMQNLIRVILRQFYQYEYQNKPSFSDCSWPNPSRIVVTILHMLIMRASVRRRLNSAIANFDHDILSRLCSVRR
jgi:hypothetical protein